MISKIRFKYQLLTSGEGKKRNVALGKKSCPNTVTDAILSLDQRFLRTHLKDSHGGNLRIIPAMPACLPACLSLFVVVVIVVVVVVVVVARFP